MVQVPFWDAVWGAARCLGGGAVWGALRATV